MPVKPAKLVRNGKGGVDGEKRYPIIVPVFARKNAVLDECAGHPARLADPPPASFVQWKKKGKLRRRPLPVCQITGTEVHIMHRHRFLGEVEYYRIPKPPPPQPAPTSLVVCPLFLIQGQSLQQCLWQQQLYRIALEQAQAVAQPSLLERDLLAVWN
jgi:hypothetical protein